DIHAALAAGLAFIRAAQVVTGIDGADSGPVVALHDANLHLPRIAPPGVLGRHHLHLVPRSCLRPHATIHALDLDDAPTPQMAAPANLVPFGALGHRSQSRHRYAENPCNPHVLTLTWWLDEGMREMFSNFGTYSLWQAPTALQNGPGSRTFSGTCLNGEPAPSQRPRRPSAALR